MTASFWYSELFLTIFQYYILFSIITCFFVVCSASAAHAVLCLVVLFILISFAFMFLGAEYIGLIFIIVYVGAIAILFLFVIMLLDLRNLIYQQFTFFQSFCFTWIIMLTSDIILYLMDYSDLPFLFLPLIPVSSLIDLDGDSLALVHNLKFLSPNFFSLHGIYIFGFGFILAFVMVGVVVMLRHNKVYRMDRFHVRNKYLVRSSVNTKKTRFPKDV